MAKFMLGCFCGLTLLGACSQHKKVSNAPVVSDVGPTKASASAAPSMQAAVNSALFADWTLGEQIIMQIPLRDTDAKGRWHYRVKYANSRVTSIEKIDPTGVVHENYSVVESPEVLTVRNKDRRGVQRLEYSVYKAGKTVRRLRSGEYAWRSCHHLQRTYNEKGVTLTERCLDAASNPTPDDSGCVEKRYTVDANGHPSEMSCYSAKGAAIADYTGVHKTVLTRDKFGSVTLRQFKDATQNAGTNKDGCGFIRIEHDRAGNLVGETCLDLKGKEQNRKGHSHSRDKKSYDAAGCLVKVETFDREGTPAGDHGVVATIYRRNRLCDAIEKEYRNSTGGLTTNGPYSVAAQESRFDDNGDEVERFCFDPSNQPTNCLGRHGNLATSIRYQHDNRGRIVAKNYFDENGVAAPRGDNYPHEERLVWDDEAHHTESSYFDEKGAPAPALNLIGRHEFVYDSLGFMTNIRNYGIDGKPVLSSLGFFDMSLSYDDSHRLSSIVLKGVKNEYVASTHMMYREVVWPYNAAKVVIERSEPVKNHFFDLAGKEVSVVDCTNSETPCYR